MKSALLVVLFSAAQGAPANKASPPPAATAADPAAAIKAGDKLLHDGKDRHKDYEQAIAAYQRALKGKLDDKARARVWASIGEAWFRRGELTTKDSAKIKLYEKGQAAAEKGLALDKDCAPCVFWSLSSKGRAGQTRGIMKSLFMLPEMKSGYARCLKIDPSYIDCLLAQAMIDVMVPGFAGGDTDRARKTFKRILNQEPNHTGAMINYAILLEDEGDDDEAIALLKKVIAHKKPRFPGAWRKYDRPKAKKLLKEWD